MTYDCPLMFSPTHIPYCSSIVGHASPAPLLLLELAWLCTMPMSTLRPQGHYVCYVH